MELRIYLNYKNKKKMKVTILKKMEREVGNYTFYSLLVKFTEKEIYEKVVQSLLKKGAEQTAIEKAVQEKEYEGEISYTFFLGCSKYTFEIVDNFWVLDAMIDFQVNGDYINPKIAVITKDGKRIEDVRGVDTGEVTGWATKAPTPDPVSEEKSGLETESMKATDIPPIPMPHVIDNEVDELPF